MRDLRGHVVNVPLRDRAEDLIAELIHQGFTANDYLTQVAHQAHSFATQEEQRLHTLLTKGPIEDDFVVAKPYRDLRGKNSCLVLQRLTERWYLAAILGEQVS